MHERAMRVRARTHIRGQIGKSCSEWEPLADWVPLHQVCEQGIEVERRVDDLGGIADRVFAWAGEHSVDGVRADYPRPTGRCHRDEMG